MRTRKNFTKITAHFHFKFPHFRWWNMIPVYAKVAHELFCLLNKCYLKLTATNVLTCFLRHIKSNCSTTTRHTLQTTSLSATCQTNRILISMHVSKLESCLVTVFSPWKVVNVVVKSSLSFVIYVNCANSRESQRSTYELTFKPSRPWAWPDISSLKRSTKKQSATGNRVSLLWFKWSKMHLNHLNHHFLPSLFCVLNMILMRYVDARDRGCAKMFRQ